MTHRISVLAAIAWTALTLGLSPRGASGQSISVDATYIGEVFVNARGGLERGVVYMDNLDLLVTVDTEDLWLPNGPTFHLYGLGNQGGNFSENYVGDAQVVSNIEAPTSWRLFEGWVEQPLGSDRFTVRTGLYDLNSEFDVIPAAGLFINSSFGIGAEYAQTCFGGPSIFPVSSLALRLRYENRTGWYAQGGVLDAVPGKPGEPRGTHVSLSAQQGALLAGETGWREGRAKVAGGGWAYTTDYRRFEGPGYAEYTYGGYLLGQISVSDGLVAFVRAGLADPRVRIHAFGAYTGGGLVAYGPFTGNPERELGLGVAAAHTGGPYQRVERRAGRAVGAAETAIELTYATPIWRYFRIQGDVQYILQPSALKRRPNALAVGLRFVAHL